MCTILAFGKSGSYFIFSCVPISNTSFLQCFAVVQLLHLKKHFYLGMPKIITSITRIIVWARKCQRVENSHCRSVTGWKTMRDVFLSALTAKALVWNMRTLSVLNSDTFPMQMATVELAVTMTTVQ